MARLAVVLSLVLVMASVAGASGADRVWFTSPGALIQGAPGVSLVLPTPGVYPVDVYLSATDNLYGYDIGLKGPAGNSGVMGATPGNGAAGWTTDFAVGGVDWAGGSLGQFHYAQSGFTLWTGGPVLVASFTFTAVEGDILGGSADNGYSWSDEFGIAPPVQFGDQWIADSGPGNWTTGPAIKVLPEPGSLMLLGLGLVGLLRRR